MAISAGNTEGAERYTKAAQRKKMAGDAVG